MSSVELILKKLNPCNTAETIYDLPVDYGHVDKVIDSSSTGFAHWRRTRANDRIQLIVKFKENLVRKEKEITDAITKETGRPHWDIAYDFKSLLAVLDYLTSENVSSHLTPSTTSSNTYEESEIPRPIGPHLIVTPSVDPLLLPSSQIASSLLAGNSVIFKPSPKVALTGQLIVEAFSEAGAPNGVINLIQGNGDIVKRILKTKFVKVVSFTGAHESARSVLELTHNHLNSVVNLSTGGKNFTVIHEDANLKLALEDTLVSSFISSGQKCTKTSIVLVHQKIKNQFIDQFHEIAKTLSVGSSTNSTRSFFMGPLIDQLTVDNYLLSMGMAKREQVEEVMRGKLLQRDSSGLYVSPSIHYSESINISNRFFQSEVMGPNVLFIPYHEIADAISIINQSEFGLINSLYSENKNIIQSFTEDVIVGSLHINCPTIDQNFTKGFVGTKDSGNYRQNGTVSISSLLYSQNKRSALTPLSQLNQRNIKLD